MHSPIFALEVFLQAHLPNRHHLRYVGWPAGLDLDFISVTYGTGKSIRRTLTARIAHTVNEYGIPSVAHLTAQYLNKDGVDQALDLFEQAKGLRRARFARRPCGRSRTGGSVRPCERSGGLHPPATSE